jgi:hypothetical protein
MAWDMTAEEQVTEFNAETLDTIFADQSRDLSWAEQVHQRMPNVNAAITTLYPINDTPA